jgi:hypothetical protein
MTIMREHDIEWRELNKDFKEKKITKEELEKRRVELIEKMRLTVSEENCVDC